jgi:signal transduction histidine kinase
MTASYVAISAGAVLIAEAVIIGAAAFGSAGPLSGPELQARARATAAGLASKLSGTILHGGHLAGTDLGTPGVPVTPGQAQPDTSGGVAIPQTVTPLCDLASASLAVAVSKGGRVLATSYPGCYPVGTNGVSAEAGASLKRLEAPGRPLVGSGRMLAGRAKVVWGSAPIMLPSVSNGAKPPGPKARTPVPSPISTASGPGKFYGLVYVQVPAVAPGSAGLSNAPTLIRAGLVVLAAVIPAGIAFGLLSTRRLIRRLDRLAASTLEVADGAFERRIPVSGADQVSRLEQNFNRMAGQLQASLDARRQLAEANARHAERSRIARELHDSISQELFSLSTLAGGLRRALPSGSPVRAEVETMERTAGETMREMQSLLLALRPVALGQAGLASALDGICRAYRERLGADIRAELEPLVLPPDQEHAILRVTQEALANAVKHAAAPVIRVRLHSGADQVTLEVADNGAGFDPAAPDTGGLGLRTMRERAAEQGGTLVIDTSPGSGTAVRASFPRRSP